ncbi:MAG: NAD(P)-binding domain-containing protein [Desulfobacterales bacterium]
MIKKVGSIGLGQMGKWMASNLIKYGSALQYLRIGSLGTTQCFEIEFQDGFAQRFTITGNI